MCWRLGHYHPVLQVADAQNSRQAQTPTGQSRARPKHSHKSKMFLSAKHSPRLCCTGKTFSKSKQISD